MPAHLQAVARGPDMVGVVDHPDRQPEHLALERPQAVESSPGGRWRRHRVDRLCHRRVPLAARRKEDLAHPVVRLALPDAAAPV